MNDPALQQAFAEQNRRDQIAYSTLASILSMILMPLGSVMDQEQYGRELAWFFLQLRIASSAIVGVAWLAFHLTGKKYYRAFGVVWYMAPTFFITWMIYRAPDPASPYYAGLNLVLVALGLLSSWTVRQNLVSALLVIAMYLAAAYLKRPQQTVGSIFNNLFFLSSTATIVVAGSFASYRQRFRAFQLRWELDQSKNKLEETNQKLRELDQIKSRFFANISHELRTPLTLLIAPLETLIKRFSTDPEMKDLLNTMHSNAMRLLKLINDLLDLVRLESGRMELKKERVEMPEFIKGLASAARQVADDKRLHLETFVDATLDGIRIDRDKLEKIILNLLFNALKFTPAGGRVELRAARQEQQVVITVADTGMGISQKNLPFVFDRFWQGDDSSRRKYQGAGIGLALVKELTEIQGGQVGVQSEEGKGTTFTVRLPYEAAEPVKEPVPAVPVSATSSDTSIVTSEEWLANLYRRAELFPALTPVHAALKPVETGSNGGRPTVLIADDEPDMLRFLKSQLAPDFHVLEAVDGNQAVEKATHFLPDLILLDMMMPEKDGLQACREIREHTPAENIPIVLLTARADEETKLAALSAGASDFMTKPFSTTELQVRVKNLVESRQSQIKLAKQKQVLESTIDQLKETETQLVQSEKVASLGRMSAGIIHEINNPLNFAATGLFTLRNKGKSLAPTERAEYDEILQDVEEGIGRVKNIVSELRMFTHPETDSRTAVDVAEVVGASLRFLKTEWKDKVQVHQKLVPNQTIFANRNNLILVLVNLVQNALDALADKTFDNHERPTLWIEGRVENGKSILAVRDNGPGIDPKHVGKIFDPFFTTKEVGKGMGLGLAICYRIVQGCEGRITVDTRPGQYCEFRLEFPVKT